MFRSLAIVSLAATVALAQSVPTGISSDCSTFLNNLNTDSSFKTCLSSLNNATGDYQPGSAAATSSTSAKVGSTLSNLCSSSVSNNCPESLVRSKLTDFYAACPAELTSNLNKDVLHIYDILYTLNPLKTAVCSKDDSGNYCVTQTTLPSTGQTAQQIQQVLASGSTPNLDTYNSNNIPFFFLQSTLASSDLCNVCTRNVMTAYLNFEAKVPYAPGLANSLTIKGQTSLYSGIVSTCGSTFLSGAGVQAAGGLSGGTLQNGAAPAIAMGQGFMAGAMGVLALIVSSAL
ncbi:hypothetical protein H0H87_007378 [Tephrocybe sp. NHM501043]|nr:hypothetical protein H0H87_007378 [Tephrocybe sp. NHM501043]